MLRLIQHLHQGKHAINQSLFEKLDHINKLNNFKVLYLPFESTFNKVVLFKCNLLKNHSINLIRTISR